MRRIRDVLRLTFGERLSRRQVSASTGIPFTTICDYISRTRAAGLSWPLPEDLDDAALEARLSSAGCRQSSYGHCPTGSASTKSSAARA